MIQLIYLLIYVYMYIHIHLPMYVCINLNYKTNKNIFWKKIKYDVGIMIDCDVAEKTYENKVGMSTY